MKKVIFQYFLHAALATNLLAVDFSTHTHHGQDYTVITVDPKNDRLELFYQNERQEPFRSFGAVEAALKASGQQLICAMNAGMYHHDHQPVGWLVINSREKSPLNVAKAKGNFFLQPNGVFLVHKNEAHVITTTQAQWLNPLPKLATQSGPMLVIENQINSLFNPQSTSRHVRNGVGIDDQKKVRFVISEKSVTFYELAAFFQQELKCTQALYFDGVVSSLYAPSLGRHDEHAQLGPIIGVVK
jgi:uncharacterized protein YigE (DUF2233 family)